MAVLAQFALYLALRHAATAYWPSWAHHHPHGGLLPWPSVVGVDVVPGAPPGAPPVAATGLPPLPAPSLLNPPVVAIAPPTLDLAPPSGAQHP